MGESDVEPSRLVAFYRRYLGEPERESDVFVGFGLFFGGIVVGALGLVAFLVSVQLATQHPLFWSLREVAVVLAMVGLPAVLLSVVVLLPVSPKATYASFGGVTLCLIAAGIFVATYPQSWNVAGTDYSPHGISVYAGGLTVLIASTGAALVAYHLDRARSDMPGDRQPTDEQADRVTDEEVRRDIDETVAASELTWGGVAPSEPRRLRLSESPDEADFDLSGFDVSRTVRSDDPVEESVAELRKLQGWQPERERGSGVGDQADALKELRAKSDEEEQDRGVLRGVVDWIRSG